MLGSPGARQQRRRRVLTEEMLNGEERDASPETVREAFRYGPAARRDSQPPATDWVPQSWKAFSALGSLTFACAAGVAVSGYYGLLVWGGSLPPILSLTAKGSLRGLVCAGLALSSVAACIVIASLRRHRLDDIRATFRIWWMAGLAFLGLAIHESTSMVADGWTLLATRVGNGAGSEPWWWGASFAGIFAIGMVRLAWEMREYPARVAVFALAAIGMMTGYAAGLGWLPQSLAPQIDFPTASAAGVLAGLWALQLNFIAYATRIIRAVETELLKDPPVVAKRISRSRRLAAAAADPSIETEEATVDPKPKAVAAVSRSTSAARTTASTGQVDKDRVATTAESSNNRNLGEKTVRIDPPKTQASPPHIATSRLASSSESLGRPLSNDGQLSQSEGDRKILSKAERKALRKEKKAIELEEKAVMRDRRR